MVLIAGLFFMSVMMLMDLNTFNRSFDLVVPLYSFLALLSLAYFFKLKRFEHLEDAVDHRYFQFKKKSRMENLTWKQKFFGEFVKTERKNFAEYLAFNGAPSFLTKSLAASDFTQIIEPKEGDESIVRVRSLGFPLVDGCYQKIYDNEEEADKADFLEYKDQGKLLNVKMFWKENGDEKILASKFIDHNKNHGYQERKLLDDQTLYLVGRLTNKEGKECSFEVFLKRK